MSLQDKVTDALQEAVGDIVILACHPIADERSIRQITGTSEWHGRELGWKIAGNGTFDVVIDKAAELIVAYHMRVMASV